MALSTSSSASAAGFESEDVELIKRDSSYQGFFKLDTLHLRHRLFAGGWSPVFTRELFVRTPAVGVLLYDPALDNVVLVEQFRVGALDVSERSPWLLEIVAGMIDQGEQAESVACREALEEAGCMPQNLEHICDYFSSPGGTSERITLYCGQVDSNGVGGIHGLPHEHEDIRVCVLSFDEAWSQLQSGFSKLDNAMSIIAMQWLYIHKEKLRAQWLNEN
ncbi:MAG: NUDIX domain-containing protein [Pseudohongiellaceae bacterium]|nr:NUDIX domain-containing protein [Pseudohongiellaceae bacterium]